MPEKSKAIDFFKEKREHSEWKDKVLGKYLSPYINKVKEIRGSLRNERVPILIVDGFAGRGLYEDGNDGSPAIISRIAEEKVHKYKIIIKCIFFEEIQDNFQALSDFLRPYKTKKISYAIHGNFDLNMINSLRSKYRRWTVFFYLDPFGVKGIEFQKISEIFTRFLGSTELLLNFSYRSFLRLTGNKEDVEEDDTAVLKVKKGKIKTVNEVMGGEYWLEIVSDKSLSRLKKEDALLEAYKKRIRDCEAKYVCSTPVKIAEGQTAKYHLIHATRHYAGLELMAQVMHKEHHNYLERQPSYAQLNLGFLDDPYDRDLSHLKDDVLQFIVDKGPVTRGEIYEHFIPIFYIQYGKAEYRKAVKELISERKVFAEGKAGSNPRINDSTRLATEPF